MNKSLSKMFSLITILALMLIAMPIQTTKAAGEPAAPSLLIARASLPGDLAIYMDWTDNSLDETAFEIERCVGVDCTDFALIATRDSSIWGPWYADVGLNENTTYSYRVRAVNAFGASAYSNISLATTSYARPDGWVSNLVGTFANGATNLTWTESSTNETRLEIERYEIGAGGNAFEVIATLAPDSTSYTDTTALRGTSYLYRVTTWRFDVYGGASDAVTVETGLGIAAPTDVKASEISKTSIRLTWKGKFAEGTQVVVQRQTCDIYGYCSIITVGQVDASISRFTDTGLAKATTYTYRLQAVSATSVSPFVTITVTTKR